jgi:tetratricopeptide (TPR) repeat protein
VLQAQVSQALVQQGQRFVSLARYDQALALLRAAVELDPTLKMTPEADIERSRALALARTNDVEAAMAALSKAVKLDPARETALKAQVSQAFWQQGQKALLSLDYDQALVLLRGATQISPTLKLIPEAEVARRQAQDYANQGEFEKARDTLRRAVELDPTLLKRAPEAEIAYWQGLAYARKGEAEKALEALRQVGELDPGSRRESEQAVADALIAVVRSYTRYAEPGAVEKSINILRHVTGMDVILDATRTTSLAVAYNQVCWWGSLEGQAEAALPACERAVELNPDHGGHADSRGLARALTGDYAGAIQDFQFYLEWGKKVDQSTSRAAKREAWLVELQAGWNPFDAATLKALRIE